MKERSYPITPVTKPRMTRRDKWSKRPEVLRYYRFKQECRLRNVYLPTENASVLFLIPMPKGWKREHKELMNGQPHLQTPDISNLLKALEDAVYGNDSVIWSYGRIEKRWAVIGEIRIVEDCYYDGT